jgi:hypothetical protein
MAQDIKTPDVETIRQWILALRLLADEHRAELQYAYDTTYCSDCPGRDDNGEYYRRYECCRDTGEFDAQFERDEVYIQAIEKARFALVELVKDEGE